MATLYTRTFNLRDSLSDSDVIEYWRFVTEEVAPLVRGLEGTQSYKIYSAAGALRADILALWEMDDASVYERALVDPALRKLLGRFYGAIDLKTAGQSFRREVTSELIRALSSTG